MKIDSFTPTEKYEDYIETENRFAILSKVNKENKEKLIQTLSNIDYKSLVEPRPVFSKEQYELFAANGLSKQEIAMLEEANYFVDVYEDEDAKIVTLNENVETYLIAKNEEGEIELTMFFFSSEETATEYYDSLGEIETEEYSIVGINAHIVYIATEEAADAINGNGLF